MNVEINENERLDDLHRNGYKIIQNPNLFCFGQDAVLLSAFAKAKRDERALDLCTGNAIVPILMCAKNKCVCYEGLEILSESVDIAKRSVLLNGLSGKINITCGDIKEAVKIYAPSYFNVITVNPPYMALEHAEQANEAAPKTIARHEVKCSLTDVLEVSARLLTYGGRFYMIHRPSRLTDIFYYMRHYKIEPKRMRLVCPMAGKKPTMALIEGMRGGNPELKVLPDLIIYNEEKKYTDEVMDIYYG